MPMEKVLVTGGAGFIGSRLVTRLCQEGIDVVVVDVLHPQVHSGGRPSALPEAATLFPLDVAHGPTWDALFQLFQPDTVVHLAAETGTGQSLLEASRHGTVNVVGTTQLLDALARSGHIPDHVVLSSSRAVYGEGEWEADGHRFYPAPRTHADLEAKSVGSSFASGGTARSLASVAGAHAYRADQCLRCDQARPGAHPQGVGQPLSGPRSAFCASRTSTAWVSH